MEFIFGILIVIILLLWDKYSKMKKEKAEFYKLKTFNNVQIRIKEYNSKKKYFCIEVKNKKYKDKPTDCEELQAYTLVIIQDHWFDSMNDAINYYNESRETFLNNGYIEKKQLGDYFTEINN